MPPVNEAVRMFFCSKCSKYIRGKKNNSMHRRTCAETDGYIFFCGWTECRRGLEPTLSWDDFARDHRGHLPFDGAHQKQTFHGTKEAREALTLFILEQGKILNKGHLTTITPCAKRSLLSILPTTSLLFHPNLEPTSHISLSPGRPLSPLPPCDYECDLDLSPTSALRPAKRVSAHLLNPPRKAPYVAGKDILHLVNSKSTQQQLEEVIDELHPLLSQARELLAAFRHEKLGVVNFAQQVVPDSREFGCQVSPVSPTFDDFQCQFTPEQNDAEVQVNDEEDAIDYFEF